MKITREKIVDELVYYIEITCKKNFSEPLSRSKKSKFITPLPVTKIELRNIIHKIVTALPPAFFINRSKKSSSTIKEYIVKEYILFQAQEDITADEFSDYLINFIYDLSDNISNALEKNDISLLT